MLEGLIYFVILVISLVLVAQAVFTLGLMLYTWARPERLEESDSPDEYLPPKLSFTAILPARHEEGVIGDTVRRVWNSSYPEDLLEVVVVCEQGDVGTIEEAEEAAAEIGHPNVRVIAFDAAGGPINKPRGLNIALAETENEVVTIFDAEDDVHPEIFDVLNTTMQQKGASIVQAGVQLMNHDSSWYSVQNVLEYFFYFKSRLHYHARVGMIPLGGNTVFIERRLIEDAGGWDEACLTEDADIGIRLSVSGEKIFVTYDAEHATREETPDSLGSFIKQRTRWCQGFFQVFRKGDWRKLPTRGQRLLAFYSLTYPYFQAFVGTLWLPAVAMMIYLQVPVGLAILSLLPLYVVGFQFIIGLVGLFDFTRSYNKRVGARDIVRYTLGFLPYQLLLSISAARAVLREVRGTTNWEKTAHSGAHRTPTDRKVIRPAPKKEAVERQPAQKKKPTTARPAIAGSTEGVRADGVRSGGDPRKAAPVRKAAPAPRAVTDRRPERPFPVAGFERMLDEAHERFGAERGSVMVLGSGERAFSIRASRELSEEVDRSASLGAGEGVVGWAAQNRAAAIIRGSRAPQELAVRLSQPGLCSSVVLPVERGGTKVVVSISSKSVKLDREALDWLNDKVMDLLAEPDSASEKIRRIAWREEKTARLTPANKEAAEREPAERKPVRAAHDRKGPLHSASSEGIDARRDARPELVPEGGAGAPLAASGGFDALLDEAEGRLGVRRASVMVLEPRKKAFFMKASRGLPERVAKSARVGVGEGVAGWAAEMRTPLIIRGQEAPYGLRGRLVRPHLASSIVLPVEQNGRTVAVVSLSSEEKRLGHEELDWLDQHTAQLLKREPDLLAA